MEPRIQYAKTPDGVNIAYWTLGEGIPWVEISAPEVSHIQAEWEFPERRIWYERVAEKRKLVRFDRRGLGLSERKVSDFSIDAFMLDLEAVADRLELTSFGLFAPGTGGAVAVTYAVRHPERVSHLVLWGPTQRVTGEPSFEEFETLQPLRDQNWELYMKTMADWLSEGTDAETARRLAVWLREVTPTETWKAVSEATQKWHVLDLLGEVKCPTLLLFPRNRWFDPAIPREVASRMQDVRVAILERSTPVWYLGDIEPTLRAIDEFLSEGNEKPAEPLSTGDVHTILFTDMESSTSIARLFGDRRAQEVRRDHNTIVRGALKASDGAEIKHTGDGIMASFATASAALDCAIAIQQGVTAHKEEHANSPLGVYIGLNAGEPLAEDDDLFGTSVDLARRICDHAEPGQILASNVVRELAEGKGFLFGDIGDVVPKGFEQPVRLYEVRWRETD